MELTAEVSIPASVGVLGATFVWFVYAAWRERYRAYRAAFVILAVAAALSIVWLLQGA